MRATGTSRTRLCSASLIALALLLPGATQAQSAGNGLTNLIDSIFSPNAATPPQAATGQDGAAPPWSGEDGASGHPLMTAAAIRQAASDFPNCVAAMWPDAARRNITQQNFERFTAGLQPDLRIMDLLDSQPEFTKAIWDYLDILVSDTRLARGREILVKYKPQFDATEKAYGVDRYIIAAIWGIESNYSTQMGDRSVVQSTATLACIGRRQAYFKDEFLSALEILNRGDLRPEQMRGSWAGAFGPTQFMPTAFKRYAVDGDGDGRRDVVDDPSDLIASTANNLKKDGWQTGASWGYEVVLPQGLNYMLADRAKAMPLSQWEQLGVKRPGGQPFPRPSDKAYLLAPAGVEGPGFLMLQNFRVIMKYNPAEAYALAIGHFADRLRGGQPFVQPWPRQERVLSRAERLELQQLLAQRGFYKGTPDGQFGGQTREALRGFQVSIGAPADGFATSEVLERLRGR
ncbi:MULTISPECIES: lytic murein transglycosylase [unclassified Bradyrhizobium]|uniref:lytic murein transglycosylase n=1 Tax=unclassified Bradyrhizobium TaxID=2631580 RepID=UPI001BA503EE|nr:MULTISPECIES: lytic murein transglycosylase [unclassified Bradyrhizobium]MBR1203575.1 lytic murein transglycosylase [Bradyrhizobium sp. AUGA SZCCT0124]MBR1313238.1 lytic murein transglycosylase [Bradyrhizobium sp. AUGA SZCCT0051]MBR1341596.1 lytic murein transglycosylase [Bradyrhizobium sp. AUGA SZCCT0105]MBR1356466.1 lytic murein transglycosylase [Bradyrhizobium sp. AUGA SZCCT0045]